MINPDAKLFELCMKDDQKAISRLYKLLFSVQMGIALRYEKNREDAISIVNHAFMKVLTNLNKWKEDVNFEAWVRRITINTSIDTYRKKQRDLLTIEFEDISTLEQSSVEVEAPDIFPPEVLEEMVRSLPATTSKVFNLYAIDGYSHKEIAEMLEMSEGTSRWHLSEARKSLKLKVEAYLELNKVVR